MHGQSRTVHERVAIDHGRVGGGDNRDSEPPPHGGRTVHQLIVFVGIKNCNAAAAATSDQVTTNSALALPTNDVFFYFSNATALTVSDDGIERRGSQHIASDSMY